MKKINIIIKQNNWLVFIYSMYLQQRDVRKTLLGRAFRKSKCSRILNSNSQVIKGQEEHRDDEVGKVPCALSNGESFKEHRLNYYSNFQN